MKSLLKTIVSILVFSMSLFSAVANESIQSLNPKNIRLQYEPSIVELCGTLDNQTFPGPPNYESIAQGDRIEKGHFLKLSEPVDVTESSDKSNDAESNVKVMHLVIDFEKLKPFKLKTGTAVKITGTLFRKHTGHQHSRVLLEVNTLRKTQLPLCVPHLI